MPRPYRPPLQRFEESIRKEPNGCWIWLGRKNQYGYAQIVVGSRGDGPRRLPMVHRWAYEHFVGPIPAGLTIDHVCHNEDESCAGGSTCPHRACVNPAHLEPKTQKANTLASRHTLAAKNRRKTHCKEGHPLSGKNMVMRGGKRVCRRCAAQRDRVQKQKGTAKAAAAAYNKTEKARATQAAYRERERERLRAEQRERHHKQREAEGKPPRRKGRDLQRRKEQAHARYVANREDYRERGRRWREANPEKARAHQHAYQQRKRERKEQS